MSAESDSDERARQQPDLAQNLEPVAYAKDRPALLGVVADRRHDRREPGDGPRPQVVAVGEPAGEDDGIHTAKVAIGVPQRHAITTHERNGAKRVPIVQ